MVIPSRRKQREKDVYSMWHHGRSSAKAIRLSDRMALSKL